METPENALQSYERHCRLNREKEEFKRKAEELIRKQKVEEWRCKEELEHEQYVFERCQRQELITKENATEQI